MAIACEHLGGDYLQDDDLDYSPLLPTVRESNIIERPAARVRAREEDETSDDASLLLRARKGDQRAFDVFYRRHWDAVLGVCIRRVRDRSLAEELMQDTFMKVFLNLLAPWPGCSLRPWLLKVAQNLCVDHQRSAHAPPISIEEVHGRRVSHVAHSDPTADQAAFRISRRDIVNHAVQALAALTAKDRVLLLQHDVEGVSYTELAGREGVSANALRNRVFRARTLIRDHLRSIGEDMLGPCRRSHQVVSAHVVRPLRHGVVRLDQGLSEVIGTAASLSNRVAISLSRAPADDTREAV